MSLSLNMKITTIGGGTGHFVLLSALKQIPGAEITAVVSMADSGGSTGRIRDELGALPPGDILKALLALSSVEQTAIRSMLLQRFTAGTLAGHNAGNMLLTVLSQYSGNFLDAVAAMGELLRVRGTVLPVTVGQLTLRAELEDGSLIIGETNIDVPKHNPNLRIKRVWLEPNAMMLPQVGAAFAGAEAIVIGPGDLFTSLIPVLLVQGVREALMRSSAKKIFISNTMTKRGETSGFSLSDFVRLLETYLGGPVDVVIANNDAPPAAILQRYAGDASYPVKNDLPEFFEGRQVVSAPLLSRGGELARHDAGKLARALEGVLAAKIRS